MAGGKVTYSSVGIAPTQLNNFNDLPEDFIVQAIDFEGVRPLQLDGMLVEETSELILTDSGIGLTDLRRVAKHYPLLTELKVDGTLVPDNELTMFAGLKSLQLLDATRTAVTESGANKLKQAIPNCDVMLGKSQEELDREVIDWILRIGGSAVIWTPTNGYRAINRAEDIPAGKLKLFRLHAVGNKHINDEEIGIIEKARNLTWVNFQDHSLTDRGLQVFSKLKKLSSLQIHHGRIWGITDEGMIYLRALPLVDLNITDARVTAKGLRTLGKNDKLKALSLGGNHPPPNTCNDDTMRVIPDLFPNLEYFGAHYSDIGDEGLATLARLPKLNAISVHISRVSDRGVASICKNKNLVSIGLSSPQGPHSNDTAGYFTQLDKLENLTLFQWKIDDRAIRYLAKIPSLKVVNLTGTEVSLRGVRQLESLKPGIKVVFDDRLEFCANAIKNGGKLKVEVPNQKSTVMIEKEEELPVKFILREVEFSNVEGPIVYANDEIRRYSFANCKSIHGSSLSNLAMLTSLQDLDLSGTSLVDEDLEQLLKAPWLQRVNLKGTPVTDAGVKALAKRLPYLRIEWDGGVIQGKKREPDPKDKKKR